MKPAESIPEPLMETLKSCIEAHGVKDAARRLKLSRDTIQVTVRTRKGGTKVMDRLTAFATPKTGK